MIVLIKTEAQAGGLHIIVSDVLKKKKKKHNLKTPARPPVPIKALFLT